MTEADPKGLIREAYQIKGIGEAECRSIFLDWALSLPAGTEPRALISRLLETHAETDHPMTHVLREGLAAPIRPERRGGRAGRH